MEEDPDSSGGKPKPVPKEMKTSKDASPKFQKKTNIKPKSAPKEIGSFKDTNSKGQNKTNKTKENTKKTSPSTSFPPIQAGTKVTSSTIDNASSERCASRMSINNLVEGEQVLKTPQHLFSFVVWRI